MTDPTFATESARTIPHTRMAIDVSIQTTPPDSFQQILPPGATKHAASFRDPSGYVFRGADGQLYRQVNRVYESHYRRLMESGLYHELADAGQLVDHAEVETASAVNADVFSVIRPRELAFISYPYEWAFSALQAAALLTLEIQQAALRHGMSLKDASAFNIQFEGTKPLLIDTLSFEEYEPGSPWTAYGQFCRHFLAPLALMSKTHIGLGRLAAAHLDGVPLDLASRLLPWSTYLSPGLLAHVHLHSRMAERHSHTSLHPTAKQATRPRRMTLQGLNAILDHLRRTISGLSWGERRSHWSDYYASNSYSDESFRHKERIVGDFLQRLQPRMVWDLGANTGVFSRLASRGGAKTFAFDIDPACVERNFQQCRRDQEPDLLPLCLDLTNPSPAIGWANSERQTIAQRGPADLSLALAIVHHLAIANNVPLAEIAAYFRSLSRSLIIEFVPKEDPQVVRMLRSRMDIFDKYSQTHFEAAFAGEFTILAREPIESGRVLYLMKAR